MGLVPAPAPPAPECATTLAVAVTEAAIVLSELRALVRHLKDSERNHNGATRRTFSASAQSPQP